MSRNTKQQTPKSGSAQARGSTGKWLGIGVGLAVIVAVAFLLNRGRPPESQPPTPTAAAATQTSAPAAAPSPEFQKLKGKWQRPDGGYVLEIGEADAGGKLQAGYFNPQPIHVAKAEATRDGGATKVFIELQDTGYPGCTYRLTYDPQSDQLFGVYYQAAMQQSYDVVFARLK
jgi:hypothetical protein